jgi:uncharacterized CHY-type Zn-finger protein
MTAFYTFWNKLFCHHDWRSHALKQYENRMPSTIEQLICCNCGKIKQIEY